MEPQRRSGLERGRELAEVLAGAGSDEVMGAERFAASWLAARARPEVSVDFRQMVGRVVADAFARLAPTEADAKAVLDGEAAHRGYEVVRQAINHTKAGRSLDAAIALHYADLPQVSNGEDGEAASSA